MTHGSLFSGIGGFDLAAQWMGWNNNFHCEWNPFGQRVLKHYWPDAESFTDITKTDFTKYANSIDIISGGFPCQPYSAAGKRLGKEDDRHLWPEMLRAIKEIRPRWVVGENVRGLTNWNGGVVFDEVQSDLELAGYEVTPFLLPAVAVNAPHRRDRIWFVAYAASQRIQGCRDEYGVSSKITTKGEAESDTSTRPNANTNGDRQAVKHKPDAISGYSKRIYISESTTDTVRGGQQGSGRAIKSGNSEAGRDWEKYRAIDDGKWPTVSPFCSGNDGLPYKLDGITFSKWSQESIKAGGNAIVPQVAFKIFKAIDQYETMLQR